MSTARHHRPLAVWKPLPVGSTRSFWHTPGVSLASRSWRLALTYGLAAALLAPTAPAAVAAPAGSPVTSTPSPTPSPSPAPSPTPTPTVTPSATPTASPSAAAPTAKPTKTTKNSKKKKKRARHGRVAVGDSLMVGAASAMRARGFTVNGKVGRQFSVAPAIVRSFGSSLKRNVVIELGTNGTVSLATCRRVVRIAGPNRRVFLVNNRVPRSWQDSNNKVLRRCDKSFRAARVRIVDWHGASSGKSAWFVADGIHTSARGRIAFAKLIDRAVDRHGL